MIRLLAAIGLTACLTASTAVAQSTKPDAEVTAASAAKVGDNVEVRFPSATILCPSRNDAAKLYIVGRMAFAQTMRVEKSAWQASDDQKAARKQAMRSLSSCEWAPRNLRYLVDQKQTTDTEVSYCLRPIVSGNSSCWWLVEDVASYSPFKDVQQP